MRKITQDSINAFNCDKSFKRQNMSVRVTEEKTTLSLHGNIIAIKDRDTGKVSITNVGWFSNTTKERLNAINGVDIRQVNFVWFLNGKEWDGSLIEV